jgi:hypothetical protein
LIGNLREDLLGHALSFPVGIEEAQHALWLLEWLDRCVEQHAIDTSIPELDAILVVLVKYQEHSAVNASWRYAQLPTRPHVPGSDGMAEGTPFRAGGIRPNGDFSQTRNLQSVSTDAPRCRAHSGQYRRGIPPSRQSG